MRRLRVWLILLSLIKPLTPAFSQDADYAPYCIPQTIFVGDKGRLVVPLRPGTVDTALTEGAVRQGDGLPRSKDLVVSRVELERRGLGIGSWSISWPTRRDASNCPLLNLR